MLDFWILRSPWQSVLAVYVGQQGEKLATWLGIKSRVRLLRNSYEVSRVSKEVYVWQGVDEGLHRVRAGS